MPGTENKDHLEIIISEVENQLVTNQVWDLYFDQTNFSSELVQIKIQAVNWMEVARAIRIIYPLSFPGSVGPPPRLKIYKEVSKISKRTLLT